MRSTGRFGWKSWASALMIAVVLMLSLRASAASKADPQTPLMPDVLILIDARNLQSNWVAITYPKVVPRTDANAAISALLRETGWTARSVDISDGSVVESGESPMTVIQFATTSTVDMQTGYLPIEPIIKAFRSQKLIVVQYVVPETFNFHGVGDFSNRYIQIKLSSGNNAYRYSVAVKDPSFKSLDLPKPQVPGAVVRPEQPSQRTVTVLIVLLAFLAAVIAFMISVRFVQSRMGTGR